MIMQGGGDGNDCGCGGDRTKKAKPNKIPQRGLGIAALEKLRKEEQQSTHTAKDAAGSSSSEHSATGIIFNSLQHQLNPVSPFLPVIDPSSNFRPLFIRKYPLFSPALDSVQRDLRLPHVPRKQLPTIPKLCQHESLTEAGGADERMLRIQPAVLELIAQGMLRIFLSLSSAPSPTTGTDAFRQHYFLPLQPSRIQKNAPEAADAMQPPALYNFMGLPGDLIGSKTGDADVNQKMTL